MARNVKRNVTRPVDARQAIVREYLTRPWYDLPDWAVTWFTESMGWITLILVCLLIPITLLALVLGAHSLPLEYLGIPALDNFTYGNNGFGLTGIVFLVEFVLLALAVRPLFKRRRRGWMYLLAAAAVHMIDSFVVQHAISGFLLFIVSGYVYWQTRRNFQA
jgi:hypothetical protein